MSEAVLTIGIVWLSEIPMEFGINYFPLTWALEFHSQENKIEQGDVKSSMRCELTIFFRCFFDEMWTDNILDDWKAKP